MHSWLRRWSMRLAGLVVSVVGLAVVSACQDSSGPDSQLDVSVAPPANGGRFLEGTAVTLSATLGASADSAVWRSSRDGRLGKGSTIVVSDLSPGSHQITVTAFAAGDQAAATVSVRVVTLPDVSILQPATESAFLPLASIDLVGEATDRDGGDAMLSWSSSIDGELGDGPVLQVPSLSRGVHTIRLVANDDEGQSASTSVEVVIADYALGFDGSGDGASTPHHADLDLTGTWTIEMWVQPYDATAGRQQLVSKWGDDFVDRAFQVFIDNEPSFARALGVSTSDESRRNTTWSPATMQDGEWQHVAVVFDESFVEVFHNGVRVDVSASFAIPKPTESPLSLGRSLHEDGSSSEYFRGLMDEVRIWNIVRSVEEIRQTMRTRLSETEPGLVASWRMEEGEGDAVSDGTGRGRMLQLGNAEGPDAADPMWHFPGRAVR